MDKIRTIWLDFDGVLVDMYNTLKQKTGYTFGELPSNAIWSLINEKAPNIFLESPPMPDAHELVSGVEEFADKHGIEIQFLTAIPLRKSMPTAEQQKKDWIKIHFPDLAARAKFNIGPHARDKHKHAKISDILIDDSFLNIRDWSNVGGIAIHHVNAKESLNRLSVAFFRHRKQFIQ